MDSATANRMNFVQLEGGGGFGKKPPVIYRMKRCRNCPRHCKPCLTVEEAEAILKDESTRTYRGNDLCQQCHVKSVGSEKANRRYRDKVGSDEYDITNLTVEDLDKMLAQLNAELAKLKGE